MPAIAYLVDARHLAQDDVVQARVEVIECGHDCLGGQLVGPGAEANEVGEEDGDAAVALSDAAA